MRFLSERIASFEPTVFDRIISDISRLRAMSSSELEVALSICTSNSLGEVNHPAILLGLASPWSAWLFARLRIS